MRRVCVLVLVQEAAQLALVLLLLDRVTWRDAGVVRIVRVLVVCCTSRRSRVLSRQCGSVLTGQSVLLSLVRLAGNGGALGWIACTCW